ncbi:hypothetical protein [Deinococcus sp.]|uniref:hypothetical protein n=1 Tax=Deinococcus sp. TaxID=47478 RepID=UPI003CC5A3F4
MPEAPENIQLEFLHPDGRAVTFGELGEDFLSASSVTHVSTSAPVRVAIASKTSQAGNVFYDFSMQGIPLPAELNTLLRVEGNLLTFSQVSTSKAGNPTRKSRNDAIIGGQLYVIEGYLTKGKNGYYVKVIAHKKPAAPHPKPRGGTFI